MTLDLDNPEGMGVREFFPRGNTSGVELSSVPHSSFPTLLSSALSVGGSTDLWCAELSTQTLLKVAGSLEKFSPGVSSEEITDPWSYSIPDLDLHIIL